MKWALMAASLLTGCIGGPCRREAQLREQVRSCEQNYSALQADCDDVPGEDGNLAYRSVR